MPIIFKGNKQMSNSVKIMITSFVNSAESLQKARTHVTLSGRVQN
jgi:hypothetical protein